MSVLLSSHSDSILEPSPDFPFPKIILAPLTTPVKGIFVSRTLYQNKPIYLQPPKCQCKQGIVVRQRGKQNYIDLIFECSESLWIQWIERFEATCHQLVSQQAKEWFQDDNIELSDIEDAFASILKPYRSSKFVILRANVKHSTPVYKSHSLTLESMQKCSPDQITPDKTLLVILEFHGIRITSKHFRWEIDVKQFVIVPSDPFLDHCYVRLPISSSSSSSSSSFSSSAPSSSPVIPSSSAASSSSAPPSSSTPPSSSAPFSPPSSSITTPQSSSSSTLFSPPSSSITIPQSSSSSTPFSPPSSSSSSSSSKPTGGLATGKLAPKNSTTTTTKKTAATTVNPSEDDEKDVQLLLSDWQQQQQQQQQKQEQEQPRIQLGEMPFPTIKDDDLVNLPDTPISLEPPPEELFLQARQLAKNQIKQQLQEYKLAQDKILQLRQQYNIPSDDDDDDI